MTGPFPLHAAAAAAACHGRLVAGDASEPMRSFSIDSRTLRAGDTFIAIVGPRFDGHAFVGEVVSRGARSVIVSDQAAADVARNAGAVTIVVDDTVAALQALARHVRRASRAQVVAITGSAGKTTTKEATASFLSSRFRTMRNRGNLNNHIGLPLSLLELQAGAEMAVVELGMNHAGEISQLVSIAEPDVRVWTNVGTAHVGFFGSMDAIAAAKAEILERATRETVLVANADDRRVMTYAPAFAGRTVTFGIDGAADVRAVAVEDRGIDGQDAAVRTPAGDMHLSMTLAGRGQLANVLAAAAVALYLGVGLADIAEAASALTPGVHRGEVLQLARGVRIFDDCYNSSPDALAGALAVIGSTSTTGARIAVLGEMFELGDHADALHRQCGARVPLAGITQLVTVGGPPARALGESAAAAGLPPSRIAHVEDSEQAAQLVVGLIEDGDLVLVKGSRGVKLERVVEHLKVELR